MKLTDATRGGLVDLNAATSWSPHDLARAVEQRTGILERRSVQPGSSVVLVHGGTADFFADLLAIWARGACAVCMSPASTRHELENVCELVNPTAILTDREGLAPGLDCPVLATVEESPPAGVVGRIEAAPDDPALMLFTSGTTGVPKGVVHTFGSLAARVAANHSNIGPDELARTLCVLPTHFGHGLIGNCLTSLLAGGRLFLLPGPSLAQSADLAQLLARERITFMSSVPAFWKIALKLCKPGAPDPDRRIHIGSAPLSADLWRAVAEWAGTTKVFNMYGITETANWVAGCALGDVPPDVPLDGLIGKPWGSEIRVLDEAGELAPRGNGEILVRTAGLMQGYFRRPDLTDSAVRAGWYRTGDIGSISEEGWVHLLGRSKDEVNRAGIKVHPEEIDLLLERHPQVLDVCAFGIPDEVSGEVLGVAVHLAENGDTGPSDLRAWCARYSRPELVPERWFLVDQIRKTDRGKVNRTDVMRACLASLESP